MNGSTILSIMIILTVAVLRQPPANSASNATTTGPSLRLVVSRISTLSGLFTGSGRLALLVLKLQVSFGFGGGDSVTNKARTATPSPRIATVLSASRRTSGHGGSNWQVS